EREVGDQDSDELIIVDDMRIRKGLMETHSHAFLALPGGIGTLEELFEIWVGRCLSFHSQPVVVLDPFDDFAFLHLQIDHLAKKGFIKSGQREIIKWTKSVNEALDACERQSN
ncbi:MAG: TIGR00730 family Rossman fold protein, partial [Actinobacteria bacterium]|nr:TIGR00730 family Rossman fold protein [Actinomycetota bacterium]